VNGPSADTKGKIIANNAIKQPAKAYLASKLQPEILLEISAYLSWCDNVSLSLTCKELAAMTKFTRTHFAQVEEKKKDARDASFSTAPAKKFARDANKLLKAPTKYVRLQLLHQIRTLFPATQYRLCYGCIKYISRNSGGAWGGSGTYKLPLADSKAAAELGPRCHRCVQRERLHRNASRAEFRMLEDAIAKI
jgi:hypothetical protein